MRDELALEAEALLRERLTHAFGSDTLAASDLDVFEQDGHVVAQVGRARFGLGHDDRLYCTLCHAGVEHLGAVEDDGEVRWIARVSIASPNMN